MTPSSRNAGYHLGRVTFLVFGCSRYEQSTLTGLETEEVGNPLPRDVQKVANFRDFDLSKELILEVGGRVSLQGDLLSFTNRLRFIL